MNKQDFSVAISVYKNDNAEHFKKALASITEEQTLMPSEIVLVVDGPVGEDINAVIVEFVTKYPIFKIVRFEQNTGLGNGLKVAVENSSYEIVARMDSDDIAVPDRFEKQIKHMEEMGTDVCGGHIVEFVGEPENVVSQRNVPITDCDIKEYMKKRCPFNHMTVMFKKQAVLSVGNYKSWHYNEDYYLWIRLQQAGFKFSNIDEILVNVRVGKEMYQRRGGWKYYKSEKALQKYMRKNKIIGFGTYFTNVAKRFIVQVLLPNKLRGWVFKKFARKKVK